MLDIFKSKDQKKEFISSYQNPFQSDKIKRIEFTIEKSFWTNNKTLYRSCVSFDTGATTGNPRIEAESFTELVEVTEAFIGSL